MGWKQPPSFDTMEKAELLQWIRSHQFAMRDLMLYLDTHSNDRRALQAFTEHLQHCKDAMAAYAERFDALSPMQITMQSGWGAWADTPWPWEKEDN